MTTFGDVRLKCAVCGSGQTVQVLCSTNQMTPPDLDLRPGEMARSTMRHWVQECRSCGYCADDLSKAAAHASALVRNADYQTLRAGASHGILASRFLRWGMLLEAAGDYAGAFACSIRAAWSCDDENRGEAARECRRRALDHASQAGKDGKSLADGPGAEELLLADVARRAGLFSDVPALARKGLDAGPDDVVAEGLRLEIRLAEMRDDSRHSVSELLSASRQTDEKRARWERNREERLAAAKKNLERFVEADHRCPHCGFRTSRVRLLMNAGRSTWWAVCPSCGCTSAWTGKAPE